jgi:hypothetical protein
MSDCQSIWTFSYGPILICVLGVGIGLSACTQVDEMFDRGVDSLAPPPSQAVHAGPRDRVRAGSLRCDSITDEHTWLDCYYGAAQPVRADLGLTPAPVSQQNLVPPVPGDR